MEIEKKYLTKELPFLLENFQKKEISQCYISTEPTIRLRKSDSDYVLTVKGRGSVSREEFELALTPTQYEKLLLKAETPSVVKTRYLVPLDDGHVAEVDIYHNALKGLTTTEVEFLSENDIKSFIAPKWFGSDISTNNAYKNTALAIFGIPKTN